MQPVACIEHKNMLIVLFSGLCGACRLVGKIYQPQLAQSPWIPWGAEEDRLLQYSFGTET